MERSNHMDRNTSEMTGGEQASFKETLILNLQRNKEILKQNIAAINRGIVLCDELVDILEEDGSASIFAEKMQELQSINLPQGR